MSSTNFRAIAGIFLALTAGAVVSFGALGLTTRADESEPRDPGDLPDVPSWATAVSGTTSPEQAAAMEDGVVTLAEYEAAIQRHYECAAAHGFTPNGEPSRGLRPTTISFIVPDADGEPDKATIDAARALIDECRFAHMEDLNLAWSFQQARMPESTVQASLRLVESCMAAQGFVREYPTLDSLIGAFHGPGQESNEFQFVYGRECRLQVEEQTGFHLP